MTAGVGNFGSYKARSTSICRQFDEHRGQARRHHRAPGRDHGEPARRARWAGIFSTASAAASRPDWKPIDGFTADFSYDHGRNENTPYYSQLVNYNPQRLRRRHLRADDQSAASPRAAPTRRPTCTACIAPLSPLVVVSGDKRMESPTSACRSSRASTSTDGDDGHAQIRVSRRAGAALDHRMARRDRRPMGQFGRRAPDDLRAERQVQPLQPVQSPPAPVQPGIPGRRQHRRIVDYAVGALLFQRACPRDRGDALDATSGTPTAPAYTILECDRSGRSHPATSGLGSGRLVLQRASHATAKSYAVFGQATWTPIEHVPPDGRRPLFPR